MGEEEEEDEKITMLNSRDRCVIGKEQLMAILYMLRAYGGWQCPVCKCADVDGIERHQAFVGSRCFHLGLVLTQVKAVDSAPTVERPSRRSCLAPIESNMLDRAVENRNRAPNQPFQSDRHRRRKYTFDSDSVPEKSGLKLFRKSICPHLDFLDCRVVCKLSSQLILCLAICLLAFGFGFRLLASQSGRSRHVGQPTVKEKTQTVREPLRFEPTKTPKLKVRMAFRILQ